MAFSKPLLFVFFVSISIFREIACNSSPLSSTRNEEASSSENNDCYKLKSNISALQSIIKENNQELRTKEEKIQGLELFIRKKSYLFESDIDFSQSENPVKHASEAEEKVYELQKQIFELRREVEMQHKRRLEAETRAEIAEKKVPELSSKLENIDGKWFLSKLGLNPNKTQAYLMTLWDQHLGPTLHITLQKKWIPSIKDAFVTFTIYLEPKVQYLTDKSIEVLYTSKQAWTPQFIQGFNVSYYYLEKWILSIKDAFVTFTIYLEPKVQYLTDKSIEVLYTSKQAWTPQFIQGFNVSYYYLEVTRIMTTTKLHLEQVQAALESCTEKVRHGFTKLVNMWRKK